jgi:hypothetical protein
MPNVTVYPMVGVSSWPASCGHQLAERESAGVRQRRVNLVLDAADSIAFGDRQLQVVGPRRQAGAGVVLQRRGDAIHDR